MSTGDGKRSRFPSPCALLFPSRAFVPDHRVKAKGIRVKRILLPLPLINGNREDLTFRTIESVAKRVLFSLPRDWNERQKLKF